MHPTPALGAALVFASAVSYALYLVISSEEVQRIGSLRLTGWASTVACVLCIVQFLVLRPLSAADAAPPLVSGCRCSTRRCARWRRS